MTTTLTTASTTPTLSPTTDDAYDFERLEFEFQFGWPPTAPASRRRPVPPSGRFRRAAAVVALSAGAFAFLVTEQLPLGLMPAIARDLGSSLQQTGLLVTGYAVVVSEPAPAARCIWARWR